MNEGQYVRQVRQVSQCPVEFISWRKEMIDLKKLKQMIDGK
mgnify:CR=1 FL=1